MRTRARLTPLLMALLLPACLEPIEAVPTDPTNPTNPTDPTAPTDPTNPTNPTDPTAPTDPTDPVDPTDPTAPTNPTDPTDPRPHTPVDPNAPVQSLSWCPPTPRLAEPNLNMPEIPAEALDPVCGLMEVGYAPPNTNQRPSSTVYVHREDGLWVIMPSTSFNNLMHVVLGGPDGKKVLEARYGMRHGLGGFAFSRWEPVYHHVYDVDGNLLEQAVIEADVRQVHVRQRFEDGRLVERVEHRNNYVGDRLVLEALTTTYTWENARLTAARAEGWGHVWTVTYTYDAAGRPATTARHRDDTVVEKMTWSYTPQNHLERRTTYIDQRFLHTDGFDPGSIDSLGYTRGYHWDTNPWPRSVPKVAETGACLMLPNTPAHGYPAEEGEYDLLGPAAERPNGLGWAYGNNTYGWNYGDLAWYGHGGIASLEMPVPAASALRLESVVTYARSRMVNEVITTLPPLDPSEPVATINRTRTLADEVAGPMVADRFEATISLADHTAQTGDRVSFEHGRDMLFSRDAHGHLVARDLIDDELGALERQTWERDAAGRWLSHEVSRPNWGFTLWNDWSYSSCAECEVQPVVMWRRYERELDDAGRDLVHRERYLDQPTVSTTETRFTYDAAGRLIAKSQGTYQQLWRYDDAGHLIQEGWDYEGDGELESWTDIEYDADNRWVLRSTWSKGSNTPTLNWRSFATCE